MVEDEVKRFINKQWKTLDNHKNFEVISLLSNKNWFGDQRD